MCAGLLPSVLDLINRQKAEVEGLRDTIVKGDYSSYVARRATEDWHRMNLERIRRFEEEIERLVTLNSQLKAKVFEERKAKAEAIKEFAERLHKHIDDFREKREMVMLPYTEAALLCIEKKIDDLVKEMMEGGNTDES
jgi:ATPase subunit of ABC transporter with duplicated ATPase domains